MENKENYLETNNEDPSIKMVRDLELQGYQRCGVEDLETTKYIDGLFMDAENQTAEQIIKKYLDKYEKDGFSDVKLVPNYTKILEDWVESKPKTCRVYIK